VFNLEKTKLRFLDLNIQSYVRKVMEVWKRIFFCENIQTEAIEKGSFSGGGG